MNKKILIFSIFLVLGFMFLSRSAHAAQVYFSPQPSFYGVGDEFTLSLLLNTEGQPINAVELNIVVPALLRIKSVSKSGSVIQLWIQEPSFSGKTISLVGGIPGGINASNGLIAKVSFQAVAAGEGNLAFSSGSSVLLNDGFGTKLDLQAVGGPVFYVVPRPKETTPQATPEPAESGEPQVTPTETAKQQAEELKDKAKPQKFRILLGEDPRVFNGQKFVSFFTTDAKSGIDRYEIKEGNGPFKIARSPYLLSDQSLRSVIRVRAYDSAGNFRESVYPGILKRIWLWVSHLF